MAFCESGVRKTFADFQQDVSVKCVFLDIRSSHHQVVHIRDGLFCRLWCLQVDRAAAGLLALGLKSGDRLGMWGPNIYEWILIQFAAAKAGIILVGQSCSFRLAGVFVRLKIATIPNLFTVSE